MARTLLTRFRIVACLWSWGGALKDVAARALFLMLVVHRQLSLVLYVFRLYIYIVHTHTHTQS